MFAETVGIEDNDSYRKCENNCRLVMNVSTSRYFVVRFVAKYLFNYKLSFMSIDNEQLDCDFDSVIKPSSKTIHVEDWDIFWTDTSVQSDRIAKMKPYQKINHFPGMF